MINTTWRGRWVCWGSAGIVTRYWLVGPGIESRWERDFPHPSRLALGPTRPPIQWVPGLSRGVKRPGRDADNPPPSSAEAKERIELYLYSTSGPLWPVIGWTLPLPLPLVKGRCNEQVLYPPQVAVESLAGIPQTFILNSMLCACLSLNNIFRLFWDCGKHKLHFHSAETSDFVSVYCLKKKLLTLTHWGRGHLTHWHTQMSLRRPGSLGPLIHSRLWDAIQRPT